MGSLGTPRQMKTLFVKKERAQDKLAKKHSKPQFNVVASWDEQGSVIAKVWSWNADYKPVFGNKSVEINGRKFAANWLE